MGGWRGRRGPVRGRPDRPAASGSLEGGAKARRRPDDVLAGIREASGLELGSAALFERVAQGPLDEQTGTVGDPLTPDRDAV